MLASLVLDNVTVDYPVYGSKKSFRSAINSTVGGLIRREGRDAQHVVVRALDQISLSIKHGDRLGIIGHNGAGKSTLLRVCAGVYEPTMGSVAIEGKVSPLFNVSPGLDPDDTGYENILTCGLFLGMSRTEVAQKVHDIEQFCELGDYLNIPVRAYSSGMLTRLCFAIATSIDPEILVLDEGLGAGDARFAEQAERRVESLVARSSIMILSSHSDALIRAMCNKAILLHSGRIEMEGTVDEVIDAYQKINQAVTRGRWDDQSDASTSVAAPLTTYHSIPLPFYKPDANFGFAPNEGRQTVTIAKGNSRHRFTATILPQGNGRATSHSQSLDHPARVIGIFGDSSVFGWGNADETTFPFILQSRLPKDLVRNFGFNGWSNIHALIKLKSLAQQGEKLNVVVMSYADFYDEINVAAASRLRAYNKSNLTEDYMPDMPGYGHPRARLMQGRVAVDMIPLFYEDSDLCDQPDPSKIEQHEVTLSVLAEARSVFPHARYLLAYMRGSDKSSVVAGVSVLGYEAIDLRLKPFEMDEGPLDGHHGPRAQVAFADKLFQVLAMLPTNE